MVLKNRKVCTQQSNEFYQIYVVIYIILQRKINIMQQSTTQIFSQKHIDALFSSTYFIDKFQQLQLQTYNDLMHIQQIIKVKNNNQGQTPYQRYETGKEESKKEGSCKLKTNKLVECDGIVSEISQLIVFNCRQAIFKQTNFIFENNLNIMNIREQIQNIKLNLSKIGQATSFVANAKTVTTQESITPQVSNNKMFKQVHKRQKGSPDAETSMFLCLEQESSIDAGSSRKKLAQDRINSFSFMNSFLNDNKISPQQQQIINERINASISKIQSSIDDRICQLQKEFTRRIEQIMKTIKHLIQMINQNQKAYSPPNPFQKGIKQKQAQFVQVQKRKPNLGPRASLNSKSTIQLPMGNRKSQNYQVRTIIRQQMKTQPAQDMETYNFSKHEKYETLNKPLQHKNLINKSSNKLASFFGLGKNSK